MRCLEETVKGNAQFVVECPVLAVSDWDAIAKGQTTSSVELEHDGSDRIEVIELLYGQLDSGPAGRVNNTVCMVQRTIHVAFNERGNTRQTATGTTIDPVAGV